MQHAHAKRTTKADADRLAKADADSKARDIDPDDPAAVAHADDDENFYVDQNGLTRWRILSPSGEVIASADRGFDSRDEARQAMDEANKDGQLDALRKFQPQNATTGGQMTTTENIHQ